MATPEQISYQVESIINKHQIFAETFADGFIDDTEQAKLNTALDEIKKEIGTLVQHPEELKLFNEELKKQVEAKGLSQEQVKKLFEKEVSDYRTQIVSNTTTDNKSKIDIGNVPAAELSTSQAEFNKNYQEKKENCETCTQDTQKELTTLKNNLSLDQYLSETDNKIDDVRTRLNFMKRGEGRDVRHTANYIKDWLRNAEFRINKFKKYDEKFGLQDIKPDHIKAMCLKLNTLLANSNDYISQGITGDLNEAKRYFPPNFFDDKSYYIPDVLPGQNTLDKQVGTIDTKGMNLSSKDQQLVDQYNKACESGSTNSGIKAIGKLIDTKMAPWLDTNVTNGKGTKVLTGAAKLGLLVANGALLWKTGRAVRDLIRGSSKDGREGAMKRLLISGGLFTALNFVDPEKVIGKGKELRGWVSGNSTEGGTGLNKDGSLDLSSAIAGINNKDELSERKTDVYGPMITGSALAGITYGEAITEGIFTCNGDNISDINTDKLRSFYATRYTDKPEMREQYLKYVNTLEDMKKVQPTLLAEVMKRKAITKQSLDNIANANIIIGPHLRAGIADAKKMNEFLLTPQIDSILKSHDPKLKNTLGVTNYDKLVAGILKLSPELQNQIRNKQIEFKTQDGKLIMHANNEFVQLDLNNNTHALYNKVGEFVSFNDGTEDVEELLNVSYHMTQTIHENKGKFMVDKPLFYNRDFGERGHSICATIGPRAIDKPGSRTNGQYVKILDAQSWFGFFGDHGLKKFKDENMLERYTTYLNTLGIWKGETSQSFINNELKQRIAKQYPTLTPSDHEKILENYLGLYNTRGNLGALLYNNGVWAKDKAYEIASDVYTFTKEKLGQGRDKLTNAASAVKGWAIEGGKLIITTANNVRKEIWEFLKDLYPEQTISDLKAKIETASKNQRGIAGKGANRLLNLLFGIQLFGEAKNQTTPEQTKQSTEQNQPSKDNTDNNNTSRELPTLNEASYAIGHAVGGIPRKTAEAGNDVWKGLKNSFTSNSSSNTNNNQTNNNNQNNTIASTTSTSGDKSFFEKGGETIGDIVRGTAEAGYNGLRGGKNGLLGKK